MASIKNCPFCGSFNTKVSGFATTAGHETTVRCTNCEATGPLKSYIGEEVHPSEIESAIKSWNERVVYE